MARKFDPGCHIYVWSNDRLYTHHGITIGNNEVIHYTGNYGKGVCQKDPISKFSKSGNEIKYYDYSEWPIQVHSNSDLYCYVKERLPYLVPPIDANLSSKAIKSWLGGYIMMDLPLRMRDFFDETGKLDELFTALLNQTNLRVNRVLNPKKEQRELKKLEEKGYYSYLEMFIYSINMNSSKVQNALPILNERYPFKMFETPEIVKRAKSRKGKNDYNLFENNCEHFAHWCVLDVSMSCQVNRIGEYAKLVKNIFQAMT